MTYTQSHSEQYSTLPKAGMFPGCILQPVTYLGPSKANVVSGQIYNACWKAQMYFHHIEGFQVEIEKIVGTTRNGKKKAYLLVWPYSSPEEILKDWGFPDLQEWKNNLEEK